ncbi:3,4-dihydroxy-2-butanone-4-phosphate synthase [Oenococcus sp. UCMA 16435]|nr:3,4-dihydroxy-2-butanone-4-phosphate synthase [Oenococcus sp. UCMA 16435]
MNSSSVVKAVEALKKGKLIIVVDNSDRENEGDLLGLGAKMTPENMNFMVTKARGLVCAPITSALAKRLGLNPMVEKNTETNKTAFTISLDGTHEVGGITTGVSAYDRAATIKKLSDPDCKAEDFVHPGHMFPLIAKDGGVLERNGHTEAAVDLAKLSGVTAVGTIVEVLRPDGHMARRDYLSQMSVEYQLPLLTIDELSEFIRENGLDPIDLKSLNKQV